MAHTTVRHTGSFGKDYCLIHEAVVTGRKVGAGAEFWSALAHDEALFSRVVEMITQRPASNSTERCSLNHAAEIMGVRNFHGPAAAEQHLGIELNTRKYGFVPFGVQTLMACKKTHVLVASPAISIVEMIGTARDVFFYNWYGRNTFAREKTIAGWHLVAKGRMPSSTSIAIGGAADIIQEDAVRANLAVYCSVLHRKAAGEWLTAEYLSTGSISDAGRNVWLRGHNDGKLHLADR